MTSVLLLTMKPVHCLNDVILTSSMKKITWFYSILIGAYKTESRDVSQSQILDVLRTCRGENWQNTSTWDGIFMFHSTSKSYQSIVINQIYDMKSYLAIYFVRANKCFRIHFILDKKVLTYVNKCIHPWKTIENPPYQHSTYHYHVRL